MTPLRTRGLRVSVQGWGFRYAGRASQALDGLDLEIAPGERVLLAGPSGSGKSTLLACLAGLLGDGEDGEQTGRILFDGRPRQDSGGTVGLVLQDPEAQAVLPRIGDDVAFGCENLGVEREEIWRRVGESLELVGLPLPWQTPVGTLSGGQKQRLALAGVLAMHPSLLLLDEPTANIDPAGVAGVRDAVRRAAERTGASLIIVEHRLDVWAPVVDRLVVLGRSGVVADGTPSQVLLRDAERLTRAGIWLPETPRPVPVRRTAFAHEGAGARPLPPPGSALLTTRALALRRAPRGPVVAHPPDLGIRSGRAVAVTGPNGAGKTTLALTLGGLLPPASGTVEAGPALARGLAPAPVRWRSRALAARIGSVFQQPERQFLAGTVRGELAVGLRAARMPRADADRVVAALLDRLDLAHLAEANPYTLSGGQKRRLSVASAVAAAPSVLILDEPTFGQDRLTWGALVDLFRDRLGEGCGLVIVSHDERLVEAVAEERIELTAAGAL